MSKKTFLLAALLAAAVLMISLPALTNAQSIGVTLPTVPSAVVATVVPPSQVSVSWGASTESSGTIEDYNVYRNGAQIATTAGTSVVDSGLTPGIYIYTVSAADANGNISMQSSPASASVLNYTMPPSTPTGVTITGATTTNSAYAPTTLTISWTAATDTIGVAGYNVYRNGIKITSSTGAFTVTSITDTVLPGLYIYTVSAYDAAQNVSNDSAPVTVVISVDTAPPSIPTNLSVQQVAATAVNLSWASSTDPVGVAGYQVFRNGIQIATAGGSPYADTGLSAGINYAYALTAYDTAGNISLKSTPLSFTAQLANGPSAPYILSTSLVETSTIKISWATPDDPLAITTYTIYRNGMQVGTAAGTSSYYLDEGLASGTYAYDLSATDISGAVSATSSLASVVVPAVSATSITIVTSTPVVPVLPSSGPSATSNATFTQFLYFGLSGSQVQALQSVLAQDGYLSSANTTGYFGSLTLAALEKFQCDQNIICTDGAGWGTVGPKTRAALNADVSGNASVTTNATTQSSLAAELQSLEAELAALEKQAN